MLNTFCTPGLYDYEPIVDIEAKELQEVFVKSQNDFSHEYAALKRRSTSVGDIIADHEHSDPAFYIVENFGFREITPHFLYKDKKS
jgi:hypothetical protein